MNTSAEAGKAADIVCLARSYYLGKEEPQVGGVSPEPSGRLRRVVLRNLLPFLRSWASGRHPLHAEVQKMLSSSPPDGDVRARHRESPGPARLAARPGGPSGQPPATPRRVGPHRRAEDPLLGLPYADGFAGLSGCWESGRPG